MRLGFKGRLYWAARTGNRRRAWCLLLAALSGIQFTGFALRAQAETLPPAPDRINRQEASSISNGFGTNDSDSVKSLTVAQLQALAERKLNKDYITKLIGPLPEWMQRIEVTGNFNLSGWRGLEVMTVQPLWQSEDRRQAVFTQLSVVNYRMFDRQRFAGNLGGGYRRLLFDDQMLVGGNLFYDYEFLRGHQRAGLGAEVKFGPMDFTANGYLGLNRRDTPDGGVERVPNGFDLEAGVQAPYLPWARMHGKYYAWDHQLDGRRVQGTQISGEANLHRYLSLEGGMRRDLGGRAEGFMMVHVRLNRDTTGNLFDGAILDDRMFARRDLSKLMLAKVRRENRIILDRSNPVQAQNGLTVTVSRGD